MRKLLPFLALFSMSVMAAHLDTVCEGALTNPPLFSENFVSSQNTITDFEGNKIFTPDGHVLSIANDKNTLWVLTTTSLKKMSLKGEELASLELYDSRNIALAGDSVLLVKKGGYLVKLSAVDLEELWTTRLNDVKDSEVIAAAFDGANVEAIMTSTNEGGFNGIATVDFSSGRFIRKSGYDYVKAGVIDPTAIGRWYQGNLILNNGGWIHLISAGQLAQGKTFRPVWKAQTVGQGQDLRYMMLKGEFYFSGSNLIGCGYYNERRNGEWVDLTKLFTVKIF